MPIQPGLEEIGNSGLKEFAGQIAEEPLLRLRGRLGRRIFNEMRLNDDAVGALLYAITMILRQVTWFVEPPDEDAESLARAEFYESVLDDMSHSWSSFISETLTMLPFGWAYFEIVWKFRHGKQDRPGTSSKFDDGLLGVRKLALRGQDTLQKWIFDDEGGIQGMKQQSVVLPIPIEKALLFRNTHEKNNPEGLSILRPAWRSWYFKKKLQELEAITVEREGAGYPIAWIDSEIMHSTEAADVKIVNDTQEIVTNIRRDELEGAVFPLSYDENGKKRFDLTLLKSGGGRQIDIGPIIQRYDRAITRSALADFLMFGGGDSSGNRSLGESRTTLFETALNATLDEIESVLNRHLVPRLAEFNGWTGALPEYRHMEVRTIDLAGVAELIKALTVSGASIFPSPEIENALLDAAGLPERMPDDDITPAATDGD